MPVPSSQKSMPEIGVAIGGRAGYWPPGNSRGEGEGYEPDCPASAVMSAAVRARSTAYWPTRRRRLPQGKSKAAPSAASAVMRWIRLYSQGARIAPERQTHIVALHGRWSVARAPALLLSSGAWW